MEKMATDAAKLMTFHGWRRLAEESPVGTLMSCVADVIYVSF
jgi:hypothetical protein